MDGAGDRQETTKQVRSSSDWDIVGTKEAGLTLLVGSRVFANAYGCGEGIVFHIHGQQDPGSVRLFRNGLAATGGKAIFDVVHATGRYSLGIPECILRSPTWRLLKGLADEAEIARTQASADAWLLDKRHHCGHRQAVHEQKMRQLRTDPRYDHLSQDRDMLGDGLAAVNIRLMLQRLMPGQKFSVTRPRRSEVHVSWQGGPQVSDVETLIDRFETTSPQSDCARDGHDSAWCEVFGSVSHLSTSRHN